MSKVFVIIVFIAVKKFISFIAPLLIATLIFFGILFFMDRKTGKGALQVTSNPKSRVYVNNKLIGNTPVCACELPQMLDVGDYTVRLVPLEVNFSPFESKITISKSTLTAVDRTFLDSGQSDGSIVSLIPLDSKDDVEILIISLPDKANVFLDSNPVGETPLLLKDVSESDHDLRLTKNGYKDKLLKIKTAHGYKLSSLIFMGISQDLSSLSTPSAAPTAELKHPKVLILNNDFGFLRVREDSSLSSMEISRVKPGGTYELIEEKDNWFRIKLSDTSSGWISADYASKEN